MCFEGGQNPIECRVYLAFKWNLLQERLVGVLQPNILRYHLRLSHVAPMWKYFHLAMWPRSTIGVLVMYAKIFCIPHEESGVNKKPKKIKTVWHGFQKIVKVSGRVNQARLKLSAGFSSTGCWTSKTCFCVADCLIWLLVEKIEAYSIHIFFIYQTLYE